MLGVLGSAGANFQLPHDTGAIRTALPELVQDVIVDMAMPIRVADSSGGEDRRSVGPSAAGPT